MPLPHWVAVLNERFTNRFVEPIVRRFQRYAVIHHHGRESGSPHRTPVYVFTDGSDYFVALTYGLKADWVRNVLAGGGTCETAGSTRTMEEVSVVGRIEIWVHLPRLVRLLLRLLRIREFMRFRLVDAG